jgi:formylglycine-generating enzyme required for sulfatase activity/serine/threonine protein kinase
MSNDKLGKYELLELLGSGATSEVYRARDSVLGREVALKLLRPALVADPSVFERFIKEAQAAAGLFHPSIATVLDMGEADGRYFIAMRLIPGQSLDKVLKEQGPLSWESTLHMARQIGSALDFAHEQGFLHRDVKPSNIIRTPKGDFVLTDFGLQRAMMSTGLTSHTGAVLGTPAYIAPEIWESQPASPATDQYALACVVYEAATGKLLFSGETPPAVMKKHFEAPQILDQGVENLPADVKAALQKALAKLREERYPSIMEFVQALEKAGRQKTLLHEAMQAEQAIPIEPDPLPAPASLKSSLSNRHFSTKRWLGIGGAVLAVAAVITMVVVWFGGRFNPKPPYNSPVPTISPVPTLMPTSAPTIPLFPTANSTIPQPTSTNSVPASANCANFLFISDVSIPDGTQMPVGQTFTKTWRVQNTGTCTWTTNFKLAFYYGEAMGGQTLPFASAVPTGQKVDISVDLKVPNKNGKLTGIWVLVDDKGQHFGPLLTLVINVSSVSPTPNLVPGSTWTRPAEGMEMVYVPAGEFLMGSPNDIGYSDEHPQHAIFLDAFWIDRTEVTNAMFQKFANATSYVTDAVKNEKGWVLNLSDSNWYMVNGANWQHPRGPSSSLTGLEDYPVVQVSLNDAKAYCEWADVRLPTEAEWEKAARGTDARIYPWGNSFPTCSQANYKGCTGDTTAVDSHPTGASLYGALDMVGNVRGWVADWYGADYYSQSPQSNPSGPASGDYRILKGGSWDDTGDLLRPAFRLRLYYPDAWYVSIGFRCARSTK